MTQERPEAVFYTLAMKTKRIEPILDDDVYIVTAEVREQDFTFRVKGEEKVPESFFYGGLAVFSNVRTDLLMQGLALGMDYLMRSGRISPEDITQEPPRGDA